MSEFEAMLVRTAVSGMFDVAFALDTSSWDQDDDAFLTVVSAWNPLALVWEQVGMVHANGVHGVVQDEWFVLEVGLAFALAMPLLNDANIVKVALKVEVGLLMS
eukprot:7542797-Ditylum_brightwellii.AAC.1